jgi:hypothetical protein
VLPHAMDMCHVKYRVGEAEDYQHMTNLALKNGEKTTSLQATGAGRGE